MKTKIIKPIKRGMIDQSLLGSPIDKSTLFVLLLIMCVSCESFIKVDPPKTQLINTVVFQNDATATSAMMGIYAKLMGSSPGFASGKITLCGGLSADELTDYSNTADQAGFYKNALLTNNFYLQSMWTEAYNYIYVTNSILEGLETSTSVTPSVSQQLQGEAKFFRAFCHFYLTNMFGDIPYIKTTDYNANTNVGRTSQLEVYQEIIADLTEAQNLLVDAYPSAEKVRPNKATATALLARAYLYTQDWSNAIVQASSIISNNTYSLVSSPANVFLKNSTEAIWQLLPVSTGLNTAEGALFNPPTTLVPNSAAFTDSLRNAFEVGDKRKTSWVGSTTTGGVTYYFPYKYKVRSSSTVTEYYMMFRLGEQYLIRAEGLAQQGNVAQSVADLNVIRARAGLAALSTSLTQAQCLTAVEKERRVELCAEWGHRWFDLKRNGRADAVLGPIKTSWQSTAELYPIPQVQLLSDHNMTQNPGY